MLQATFREEFLVEIYKSRWEYYKITLTNRKDLLEWYFKIITIPVSALGLTSLIGNKTIHFDTKIIGYILLSLSLAGTGILIAYSLESGNSKKYIDAIKKLENKIVNTGHILTKDKFFKVSNFNSIVFWRITPIIVVNATIFVIGLTLIYDKLSNYFGIFFIIGVFIQVMVNFLFVHFGKKQHPFNLYWK